MPQMDTIAKTTERANREGYGITEYTLRRWVKQGIIPSVKAGNKTLLWYPNLEAFLQGKRGCFDGNDI